MPDEPDAEAFTTHVTVTATAYATHPDGAVVPEPDTSEE